MFSGWPDLTNTQVVLFYIGWCIVVYVLFKPKIK